MCSRLRAIRTVYPDARLIFVHRDPVKVLLSVAHLTEVLRRPFTRSLDPKLIGRDESARWLAGAERMMETGDDAGLPEPVCHVHHMDLISDPVATVDGVYRHFGMCLPDDAAARRSTAMSPSGQTAAMAHGATRSRITAWMRRPNASASGPICCASASPPMQVDVAGHGSVAS